VIVGEVPKKKRKKKRKTGNTGKKLSFRSQPEPYQIPLHYPPFPATIPRHKEDNSIRVADMLRNYIGVQKNELNRLRGDLTAYRQEAQTVFRQKVAYPRASVDLGRVSDPSEDFTEEVMSDITDASVYNPPAPPDAPSVVLQLQTEPLPLPPVPDMNYLMAVEGFGAEPPPAPIPLIPEPLPFMQEVIPILEAQSLPLPFMQEELPKAKLADVDSPIEIITETPFDLKATDLNSLTENLDIRKPKKRQPATPISFAELYSQTGAAEEAEKKPAEPPRAPPIEFRQEFERPEPPARRGRGGRREGAGRPLQNFKSNTELRRILKNEYGIVGTSRLSTSELKDEVIRASGDKNIIYKG
jgi:hypothetical protein